MHVFASCRTPTRRTSSGASYAPNVSMGCDFTLLALCDGTVLCERLDKDAGAQRSGDATGAAEGVRSLTAAAPSRHTSCGREP